MMQSRDNWRERDAWRNHGLVSEEDDSDSADDGGESSDYDECDDQLKPPPVDITSDNTIIIKEPLVSREINNIKKYSLNTLKETGKIRGKNDKQEIKTSPIDLLEISTAEDSHIEDKIIEIADHGIEEKRKTRKKCRRYIPKNKQKENVNQNIGNISDMKYVENKKRRKSKYSQVKAEDPKTHNNNKEIQLYPALANIEFYQLLCDIENKREASTGKWFSTSINPELLFAIGYLLVHWCINNSLKNKSI